ncbi:MAG TPA: nitrate reductase molybdenum cofactor assembly chaperone [Casimicrobiaceae bacterium]|nr:nitrate reductase molybdenum cofactor assembly chaperone [Casimicrobiaceae bacterium]
MTHDPRHLRTLRALAALLQYPDARLRAALPEIVEALDGERALSRSRSAELVALARRIAAADPYDAEADYVETFDRGRATSLQVFEHVHGDSRERGPALVDLRSMYEQAGLRLAHGEMPDYLPVILEFASTQPKREAREFLGELLHVLRVIFSALVARRNPYAAVLAAAIELAGGRAEAVAVAAEPALDEAWAEPPAFDGCSARGQASPQGLTGVAQPIRIVRKSVASEGGKA